MYIPNEIRNCIYQYIPLMDIMDAAMALEQFTERWKTEEALEYAISVDMPELLQITKREIAEDIVKTCIKKKSCKILQWITNNQQSISKWYFLRDHEINLDFIRLGCVDKLISRYYPCVYIPPEPESIVDYCKFYTLLDQHNSKPFPIQELRDSLLLWIYNEKPFSRKREDISIIRGVYNASKKQHSTDKLISSLLVGWIVDACKILVNHRYRRRSIRPYGP